MAYSTFGSSSDYFNYLSGQQQNSLQMQQGIAGWWGTAGTQVRIGGTIPQNTSPENALAKPVKQKTGNKFLVNLRHEIKAWHGDIFAI